MEEYQISASLSGMIFEEMSRTRHNIERIGQYDIIFAKAKHSESIGGIEPKVNRYGYIKLINCKHPLLHGEIVPLNFEIGKNYRSLVICLLDLTKNKNYSIEQVDKSIIRKSDGGSCFNFID